MSKLSITLALMLYYVVTASHHHHHFHTNRCLPASGKYPFCEEKFSGDWYVVARAFRPEKVEGEVVCDKLHYSAEHVDNVTRTHISIHFKMDDGTERMWEAKGIAVKPGYASLSNMAWKSADNDKWHSVLRHAVLATDYESYALIHACKEHYNETTDSFSKLVYDQIWSRTPHMDKTLLHTLKSVMSSIDIEDDEWQDVTNDAC